MVEFFARCESFQLIFNERSRSIWAAAEALSAGRGGVTVVNRVETGIPRTKIEGITLASHKKLSIGWNRRPRAPLGG